MMIKSSQKETDPSAERVPAKIDAFDLTSFRVWIKSGALQQFILFFCCSGFTEPLSALTVHRACCGTSMIYSHLILFHCIRTIWTEWYIYCIDTVSFHGSNVHGTVFRARKTRFFLHSGWVLTVPRFIRTKHWHASTGIFQGGGVFTLTVTGLNCLFLNKNKRKRHQLYNSKE